MTVFVVHISSLFPAKTAFSDEEVKIVQPIEILPEDNSIALKRYLKYVFMTKRI